MESTTPGRAFPGRRETGRTRPLASYSLCHGELVVSFGAPDPWRTPATAAARHVDRRGPADLARTDRPDVRLRHHALRRDAPWARRHVPGVRPGAPAMAGQPARRALCAERHRH